MQDKDYICKDGGRKTINGVTAQYYKIDFEKI